METETFYIIYSIIVYAVSFYCLYSLRRDNDKLAEEVSKLRVENMVLRNITIKNCNKLNENSKN